MKLFPGEKLKAPQESTATVGTQSDEPLNQKYIKGDVRIVTEQARYPLSTIASMVESKNYELNPEFQRRHRWNNEKKSRLIETFIMNVPVPPIFLYEDTYSHYEVMDGLQRLTAIHDFYTDGFPLTGLIEWKELNGRFYSTLPDQVRRGIDRRYLSSIILLQETAKSEEEAQRLKQIVFERLNSGGVLLEFQESRNAIYDGPLNRLCIELSRNPYLCRMWGIPEPDKKELAGGQVSDVLSNNDSYRKMEDVELVLRFFAYRQRLEQQKGALKDYLDYYLKEGNTKSKSLIIKFKTLFENTIKLVHDTLGNTAFHLYRKRKSSWSWFNRPTIVLYDPIMFVFSQHLDDTANLIAKRLMLKEKLPEFFKENYSVFEGRNVNRSILEDRNRLLEHFITEILATKP